jgi:CRISPR/Cas system CSM-associated protein Csm3 (group 7 of RAMP superfamily)
MSFQNRWMVVGKLTSSAPLHVGNGDVTRRKELVNAQKSVDINAVCTDKNGRAFIPGTTLKGNLRSWAKRAGLSPANFEQLFGSEDSEKADSVGGKIEFYDAVAKDVPAFDGESQPPFWDAQRLTGVMTGVVINRRTCTASEERLFHHEFVPPGVSFNVTITGQNLSDAELEDLLFVFAGFNEGQVKIGADEAGGWGEMTWKLTELRRITNTEVANWINSGAPSVGYGALAPVTADERQAWSNRVAARRATGLASTTLKLGIVLEFESHFLVNDPSRTGKLEEGKMAQTPLLDVNGRLLLPASSFRGALRSQAEKIIRTVRDEQAACYPDDKGPRPACEVVYDKSELGRLCPACKVFGAPGWKSPISITDFVSESPLLPYSEEEAKRRGHETGKLCMQEFVAIDRFTGGGSHGSEGEGGSGGKKFNAASVYRPRLSGMMTIDLEALQVVGASGWAAGLLALALRDLLEGDIRLGFGSAKGYGVTRAQLTITDLPDWNACPEEFKSGLDQQLWNASTLNALADREVRDALRAQVAAVARLEVGARQ